MKRPFFCKRPGCTKSYTTRFSLRRHMTSHQSVKQHVCVLCFKSFTLAQYLKEHTYIHTGQKPFQCDYPGCDRSFRQAGKLSMHRKFHQNIIFTVHHSRKMDNSRACLETTIKAIRRLQETGQHTNPKPLLLPEKPDSLIEFQIESDKTTSDECKSDRDRGVNY